MSSAIADGPSARPTPEPTGGQGGRASPPTDSERHLILTGLNTTRRAYPQDQCIHQLFEAQAAGTPEAVALVFGDEQLTYRQLNERSNKLAHYLRSLGVGPDTLVGICVERSADMVSGLLGILKAGGAYVPLDPAYPTERLAFMLADTRAPVVVVSIGLRERLPKLDSAVKVCCVEQWNEVLAAHSADNPPNPSAPDNIAYVMYTSGSTGRPKGVEVPHRGVVRLVANGDCCRFGPDEAFLQMAPVSFDASTLEIWGPLLNGGRLILCPQEKPSIEYLSTALREGGVTTLWLTAGLFHLAIDECPTMFGSLRQLLAGGDALSPRHVDRCLKTNPHLQLINGYGPTENTTFTCCHAFAGDQFVGETAPIGRPIANTTVYILDPVLRPAPMGVPGELYTGGDGLARGYLNRPDQTAEKFIPNPFSDEPGARLYRTGDLARYLPDGSIEFLGRMDHQVKIRGFRIELDEIESVLSQHAGIRRNVVIAREDMPGDKRLVAYLVAADDQFPPSVEDSRSFLQSKLPDYMVPSAFVFLPTLPLTPNGKIDRKALPAPDASRPEMRETYVAPRNATEELLVRIWEQVLRLERVGIHDNFFVLGGHSLLATQVVSRVRGTLNVELPLRSLFEFPTVAGLAGRIQDAAWQSVPPILATNRGRPLQLSFAQQRLWFLDRYESENAVYNVPIAVHLSGRLDAELLRRALEGIVTRHESLRTCFETRESEPVQVIDPAAPIALPVTDLSDLSEEERHARAEELSREEARRPFDLERGPLLRALLLRLSDEEHILVLTCHHIACDGWSMGILFDELKALYRSLGEGTEADIPALPVQYADYAAWQRDWLQGEVLERQLTYWKARMAGAPELLELPTDRPRPAVQSHRGACHSFTIPRDVSEQLVEFSRRQGVTLYMTLLAAFQVLLHRYSGQDDIVVGSPIAGRNRSETENLIGFFVNTLIMRTDLSGNPTVEQLLGRIRETALGAYANQDVPFERLVEELNPVRSLRYGPLFQVMLVLQNAPASQLEVSGLKLHIRDVHTGTAKFDLVLILEEAEQRLSGALEFSADLFDQSTIDRMVGHFQQLLEGFVTDPTERIVDLPLLLDSERHLILTGLNTTRRAYPQDQCIHQLFEAQAAGTPEAVALVFGDEQLTYRQLNERSNKLAHYLRSLGVGPDTLVGICVERSADMVSGLLGILKAGGAYVPLDPAYPTERLAFMLADTRAPVVVVSIGLRERLPKLDSAVKVCCVEQWNEVLAAHSADNPPNPSAPDNIAYVMYTSGSTGRPKGVEVPHRGVVRLVANGDCCRFGPDEAFLQMAPVSFDASTLEIWGPLLNGGRLILCPQEKPSIEYLSTALREGGVTTLWLTAGLFHLAIDECPTMFGSLRQLLAGGDALSPRHVDRCLKTNPHLQLINGYGPTENTTFTCCHAFAGDQFVGETAPIGRPIANTTVYILDPVLRPAPMGVPGELYTGGDGLARGYLNRPDQTAEKFIPNPFSDEPGARLYRTGDLARYLPDGSIEFLGRMDHQVKIRGFRIELDEIESVLSQHAGIRRNVVIAREDMPGDKRLVAYLVAADDQFPPSVEDSRSFLQSKLPDYMVPSAFVFLPTLPLTPNGKIDRKALPAPDASRPEMRETYVAPRNATEELLVRIWEQVLRLERVGIHDNFFVLGGHSLKVAQLAAAILRECGIQLPLPTVFLSPTVEALAMAVDRMRQSLVDHLVQRSPLAVALQPNGNKPPLFFAPGVGGHPFSFRHMAELLGPDRPVYGFLAIGLDGSEPPPTRIEEYAERYIREMVSIQPQGPYHLVGYSFGGRVVFEMARQLMAAGKQVRLVGLLDTFSPGYPRLLPVCTRFRLHLAHFRKLSVGGKLKYLSDRVRGRLNRLQRYLDLGPSGVTKEISGLKVANLDECNRAMVKAFYSYRPDPISMNLVILRAENPPGWAATRFNDPSLGWGMYTTGSITHYVVPGNHLDFLKSTSHTTIAAILADHLELDDSSPEREQRRFTEPDVHEA